MAHEAIHSIMKDEAKVMIVKLHISKAYEQINWNFLLHILTKMGLTRNLVASISHCISMVRFLIMVNVSPRDSVKAQRGLSQVTLSLHNYFIFWKKL